MTRVYNPDHPWQARCETRRLLRLRVARDGMEPTKPPQFGCTDSCVIMPGQNVKLRHYGPGKHYCCVVGVVVPALHRVRPPVGDIQKILGDPVAIRAINDVLHHLTML